jgi:hypothetical protein
MVLLIGAIVRQRSACVNGAASTDWESAEESTKKVWSCNGVAGIRLWNPYAKDDPLLVYF